VTLAARDLLARIEACGSIDEPLFELLWCSGNRRSPPADLAEGYGTDNALDSVRVLLPHRPWNPGKTTSNCRWHVSEGHGFEACSSSRQSTPRTPLAFSQGTISNDPSRLSSYARPRPLKCALRQMLLVAEPQGLVGLDPFAELALSHLLRAPRRERLTPKFQPLRGGGFGAKNCLGTRRAQDDIGRQRPLHLCRMKQANSRGANRHARLALHYVAIAQEL
jgi:hypothetical protein